MEKNELEALRARVGCAIVLEKESFAIDPKQSTRRAVKYRRGDEIIIVIHEDRGWFDARSDAKGDVFALASYLTGLDFPGALDFVGELVSFQSSSPIWSKSPSVVRSAALVLERWEQRRRPWRGSATWTYLKQCRRLPWWIVSAAITADVLREGPFGSMWAKHSDASGAVIGWEERGPDWRGYSTGGAKELFRLGERTATRICVAEAAIDAMSLAAIEERRRDTLYVSTGGGWAPKTSAALEAYAARPNVHLVAATDANVQGDVFADRIRHIADVGGCDFSRLRPSAEDWNEELKRRGGADWLAPARSAHQG